MKVVMRVDSSQEIGTGHVMRCLALAKKLEQRQHNILFVCKRHPGHLFDLIARYGFSQVLLDIAPSDCIKRLPHAHWVGGCQKDDAKQSIMAIQSHFAEKPDWIIVDHYGLDSAWHKVVKQDFAQEKIMVIDDLVDREHCCDLFLDQTYGRSEEAYSHLLPQGSKQLLGSKFALLRDEFLFDDRKILQHRKNRIKSGLGRILIMMGGTDNMNKSPSVVKAIANSSSIEKITVVLGETAAWKDEVAQLCQDVDCASLIVGSDEISQLLLEHDICIGAAGSSAWERCALGLPTLIMALFDNQKVIAHNLVAAGACLYLQADFDAENLNLLLNDIFDQENYLAMVVSGLKVCDGRGAERTAEILETAVNYQAC